MSALKKFWSALRRISGDDAYERYLQHHCTRHEGAPLSRTEFFRAEQARKWSGGPRRCC